MVGKNAEVQPSLFDKQLYPDTVPELYEKWRRCTRCGILADIREGKEIVSTNPRPELLTGPIYPPVLVVGQAVGVDELETGLPFTGNLGRYCIEEYVNGVARIAPEAVVATNSVSCQLPFNMTGTYVTDPLFARRCHPLVEGLIHIMRPKLIIVMGSYAMQSFGMGASVKSNRRRVTDYKGAKMILTALPAMAGHTEAQVAVTQELQRDYEKVREVANTRYIREAIEKWTTERHKWNLVGFTPLASVPSR